MTGITRALADFAAELAYDDLPHEVIERTKLLIFDITGVMVQRGRAEVGVPAGNTGVGCGGALRP